MEPSSLANRIKAEAYARGFDGRHCQVRPR
jgi:hypothetical protein